MSLVSCISKYWCVKLLSCLSWVILSRDLVGGHPRRGNGVLRWQQESTLASSDIWSPEWWMLTRAQYGLYQVDEVLKCSTKLSIQSHKKTLLTYFDFFGLSHGHSNYIFGWILGIRKGRRLHPVMPPLVKNNSLRPKLAWPRWMKILDKS